MEAKVFAGALEQHAEAGGEGLGGGIGANLFASALLLRVLATQAAVFEKNSFVVDVKDEPIAEILDAELAIARNGSEAFNRVRARAVIGVLGKGSNYAREVGG